jgi:hypothetical protein
MSDRERHSGLFRRDDGGLWFRARYEVCPRCGSDSFEQTTIGWGISGEPQRDPNKRTCKCGCSWKAPEILLSERRTVPKPEPLVETKTPGGIVTLGKRA